MQNRRGVTLIEVMIVMAILGILFAVFGKGVLMLSQTDSVIAAAEKQGYEDIVVKDKAIMFVSLRGCGGDDGLMIKASAMNPRNQRVDIILCAGFYKGVTVRTE